MGRSTVGLISACRSLSTLTLEADGFDLKRLAWKYN